MSSKIETTATPSLVAAYAAAATQHGEATASGDYRTANRKHDEVAAIYRELRRRGITEQRQLLMLLTAENIYVRGWAAAHALEFAPAEGERVLTEIATAAIGTARLNAEMTLNEWRKQTLHFP